MRVIFGLPGMVLATIFVTLPFVVREVEPVLHEIGDEQEQAAATLGASRWQTFWRITLPAIRWGLTYGVVLTVARSLGEFGAVIMVSSGFPGVSQTLTLLVHSRYIDDHNTYGAYCRGDPADGHRPGDAAADDPARPQEEHPMITVTDARKNYGDFAALDDVTLDIPVRLAHRAARPQRLGQVDAAAVDRRARGPGLRHRQPSAGIDVTREPPQKRDIGFVFQHYAAFKHMTVRDNVAFGLKIRKRPKAEIASARSTSCSRSSGSTASSTATRRSCPAVSASGWRWPARSPSTRRCCCSTSRSARSTPRCAPTCGTWLRRLHDEVHVTTVLVTHDQEEALDVADRIAVLNKGRIEQVGDPVRSTSDPPTTS